jgi:hypothetical protein
VDPWLSGYWCPDTKRFVGKRGPKKKHCLGSVGIELLQKLLVLRQARLVNGEFEDQPERWLWYVMRCKKGWRQVEILPRFPRYKLFSGLITRKRRPGTLSRASIKAVALAVAVLVAVVVPLACNLTRRESPQKRGSSYIHRLHSASPVGCVRQKARGPPARIAPSWGDSPARPSSRTHSSSGIQLYWQHPPNPLADCCGTPWAQGRSAPGRSGYIIHPTALPFSRLPNRAASSETHLTSHAFLPNVIVEATAHAGGSL